MKQKANSALRVQRLLSPETHLLTQTLDNLIDTGDKKQKEKESKKGVSSLTSVRLRAPPFLPPPTRSAGVILRLDSGDTQPETR